MLQVLKIGFAFFALMGWACAPVTQDVLESSESGKNAELFIPSPSASAELEICTFYRALHLDVEARLKLDPETRAKTVWEIEAELQAVFPDAKYLASGFGSKAYVSFDYDHDGHEENFYFEYEDPSNRPGTKTIFLYESQTDIDADLATLAEKGIQRRGAWSGNVHAIKGKAVRIGTFIQWNNHIYRINGALYLNGDLSGSIDEAESAFLYRLDPGESPEPICV